jgi:predicted dehydrogenase
MPRRRFLRRSLSSAAISCLPWALVGGVERPEPEFRAAIIGHTGHGDYGHEHDLIFNGRPNVRVVVVADPDERGRARAAARSHALRSYADYRQMLEQEKPHLVCVAPRWTDQHFSMTLAALQAGAHVYIEKPFTQTLAEADELLAVAKRARLRITVAHQMRLVPNILALKQSLEAGLVGDLLEIRAHGKQDHRAGGEDLVVLGVHLFDLMRFFAGDPTCCVARVTDQGHEISLKDAHPATENIGPVAGDEIEAGFNFPKGIYGTFTSRARSRAAAGPWGLELIGSKGSVRVLAEVVPKIYTLERGDWSAEGQSSQWRPWKEDPTLHWSEAERGFGPANARVVDDWLAAIAQHREPACSGYAGMKALEMALAVFAAGLSQTRIELPLKNRQHPLKPRP